ncbi:catalase [Paraburkholderia caballeronis]|uniref:Catalase n=1 Tax=Paraburkholderia caballeronis TaxID=416943 RepID=A0A1H7SX92_9BURK|nr:catalase [Paraburkholderia caballeronis]PXW25722.1 catalase [Paraburkholderia caballeronis]PXX01329.1 catalase [Paraburkholderia caballeronis]RAJ99317.1 catalase [Paraburkholderia caballeronis]SEE25327.1 catalase [Paraburkholderia caballeronis]SEL77262.1 catalase [Paraburkholderia caballeronis]
MATRKRQPSKDTQQPALDTAYLNSDSGPALPPAAGATHPALRQARAVGETVSGQPANQNKAAEYGEKAARPPAGATVEPTDETATASTLSEKNRSGKTGARASSGVNAAGGELVRVRADSGGQAMTTNQGVPVADNQSSLKAGLRGPALLKDFILREKITHFDHERIPERIVHARGSAAHGYFECYEPLAELTSASLFAEAGKRTPVFVRFSTVAGERGSKDTARDVRGFAVKFYTDQGNWDLVGNNMPVFFIQDAMKFPDLIHAVKPEPHHGMPQAASAHDTLWDFISLMPESTHMMMWLMSDRGIPRSYRMMQGFGVHTFRFVTAEGLSRLVKFHWNPKLGTHSHVWDEAVKISGADPDYHRRDLWEAIEAGEYPEWELGVQIFDEAQADTFSFDVLDATKIVPEELVPITPIGRMVLDRNPDNFFAETEQVAFCTAHVVPGIDFTNDPLLAGRIHSYVDTQITRLGGPNFHELPINTPLAPVHNNQRDGMHRQAVHRGRVAYEPNSLAGGCPFQAGAAGFVPFPEPVAADELRGKPEKFAEHYNQATLFYESQADHEKQHIIEAFSFELSKVGVPGIRQRTVATLRNVSEELAQAVAANLGMPELPAPLPKATTETIEPEVTQSAFLSLLARPGEGGIRTRKIAIMVTDGVNAKTISQAAQALIAAGAVVRLVGQHIGLIQAADGETLDADASFKNSPAVLFDAVVVPDGETAVAALCADGLALEFVREPFRHGKALLVVGEGSRLLEQAGIPFDSSDPGLITADAAGKEGLAQFIEAVEKHRHPARESDPPAV